jgi:hypothetical protein
MLQSLLYDFGKEALFKWAVSYNAPLSKANRARILFLLTGAFVGVIGLIFILSGYYIWLTNTLPLSTALMIFGLTVMGISALFFVMLAWLNHVRDKKVKKAQQDIQAEIEKLFIQLKDNSQIEEFYEDNTSLCLAVASLAGAFAGDRMAA